METYKIYNHLGDLVKTVRVKSEEEVQDIIYDLREYHGFNLEFTYEKVEK